MDVLSSFICHSDWIFHGESCPCIDVVHPGHGWTIWRCMQASSPACTWHCSLHYLFLQSNVIKSKPVTLYESVYGHQWTDWSALWSALSLLVVRAMQISQLLLLLRPKSITIARWKPGSQSAWSLCETCAIESPISWRLVTDLFAHLKRYTCLTWHWSDLTSMTWPVFDIHQLTLDTFRLI